MERSRDCREKVGGRLWMIEVGGRRFTGRSSSVGGAMGIRALSCLLLRRSALRCIEDPRSSPGASAGRRSVPFPPPPRASDGNVSARQRPRLASTRMLHCVHIHDLALIEHAVLDLDAGLSVISGETGGGKSLVITALELLRGEKAKGSMVRRGAKELRVDGEFRLGEGSRSVAIREFLFELVGVELEEDLLVVTRIVDASGRSRVRLAGRPSTLAALRTLGSWLLEIHGQGKTRALMRPEIQSEVLDGFAGLNGLRASWAGALKDARRAAARVVEAGQDQVQQRERLEFLRFQHGEMTELGLDDGETDALEAEHRILAHLDRMRELLGGALDDLQDGEDAAADSLASAARALHDAATIDDTILEAATAADEAMQQVADAVRVVQSAQGKLELDPARFDEVDARLSEVRRMLQRFGPSESDFRRRLVSVTTELEELALLDSEPEALAAAAAAALAAARKAGTKLINARKKAGAAFARAIESELSGLGMEHTALRVHLQAAAEDDAAFLSQSTAHGPGEVDFEVRVNPGEPFQSLRETASGGEVARIVLGIKKALADQDRVPLLVLDEIDAEIGGRLGLQVGRKLAEVAEHHQVFVVTHLPQVAAFADQHFVVEKGVTAGRTASTVRRLTGAAIAKELVAMAAGDPKDHDALAEAKRLVARAQEARQKSPVERAAE